MGVVTQHFNHEKLGHVYLLVKPTARSIKAHWKGKVLHVTAPAVSSQKLLDALNAMADKLLAVKPAARYYIGQVLEFEHFKIVIRSQNRMPQHLLTNRDSNRCTTFGVGTNIDLDSEQGEVFIEKAICNVAKNECRDVLIAEAKEVSNRLGVFPPEGFEIGYGRKRMGCCINRRRISLSFMLIFMPKHLREYIVCHELAHLTHMDHSPAFHAVVNRYTNGNEARLEAELRKFKFPISR